MNFGSKIKDFFLGPLKTVELKLSHAKATVILDDDSKHVISRCGYVWFFRKPYSVSGKGEIQKYMSDSSRSMLVTDLGDLIPVCKIKSVTFKETYETVTETWR